MQAKIGFIGLGSMGKPMAANIAKAGFELTVYDLREEPCKELAALSAGVAASPREVAEKSDIVEIAVVDDAQAERVVMGEDGVIHGARAGSIVAIHSTILPGTVRKIAARCRANGVDVIDVPMSGGLHIWWEVKRGFWKNAARFLSPLPAIYFIWASLAWAPPPRC
jgi:3-hydroxyisobutyrate dehydrogenase-like beta-hydroxyacid dehydrogenase